MSLKPFDDTILDDDDEFETPNELFWWLCRKYCIVPILDASANNDNSKTKYFLKDALFTEWVVPDKEINDVWCNPPHSKTEEFVKRAQNQWEKYGMNIMMIIPANAVCTHYFEYLIESNVEIYPITGRPRFLRNGRPSKFPSRNSYFVVIWRKK